MQIEIKDIKFTYNKNKLDAFEALKGISFNIEKGDFIALVGKTGSGKSTLVQCLNALSLPTEGYIRVEEFYVLQDKKTKKEIFAGLTKDEIKLNKKQYLLRKKVGMVFQFPEYQLFEDTVLKDVMFGPKNFKVDAKEAEEKAKEALQKVGLNETYYERSPFELSGGEKRRVAIAGILASDPDILVLDEPTAGLDPRGKSEIMNLVKDISKQGKTVILVTHDMDVVLDYVSKVIVLNDGKLVKETTPYELFNNLENKEYSLEIPTLYKFKNLLKEQGFKGKLDDITSFDDLILRISEVKHD